MAIIVKFLQTMKYQIWQRWVNVCDVMDYKLNCKQEVQDIIAENLILFGNQSPQWFNSPAADPISL